MFFNVNFTHNNATGWIEFDVDDIFNYDGVHNLLVQVEWSGTAYGPTVTLHRGPPVAAITNNYWVNTNTQGSATGATANVYYNINILYLESANLTWSASSSDTNLFTAGISGNDLVITPVPDAFGDGYAHLTLTNNDGGVVTQDIPVTINAVNDAPILSGPESINCTEDIERQVNMTGYVTDIDSLIEGMTYSVSTPFASVNGSIITFLYPELSGIYEENVTITVNDGDGGSDTWDIVVNITPINDMPEFTSYINTLTCDAEVNKAYTVHPDDEETKSGNNLTVTTNSAYATVNNHVITFNYPKGIGSESVTISLKDGSIYGVQNTRTYILAVTINDHPDVVDHSPITTNSSTVPVTSVVVVEFDMPMNTTTTENAFDFSKDGVSFNGTFSWTGNNTIMTFTPTEVLGNGLYDVIVRGSATNSDGFGMYSAYSWNFTAALGSYDGDGDGMPDQYEIDNGLNPDVNDAEADLDGDGMPNIYEYENDLDPAVNDADADADDDGATNLEEYEADTDPNDSGDMPSEPMNLLIVFLVVIIIVVIVIIFMLKGKKDKPVDEPGVQEWQDPNQPGDMNYGEGQYDANAPPPPPPGEPMEPLPPQDAPPAEPQFTEPEAPQDMDAQAPQEVDQPPKKEMDPADFLTEE